MDNLKRRENENIKEYKVRLCLNKKEYNLNWQQIADLINKETGDKSHRDRYRKWFDSYYEGYEDALSNSKEKNKDEVKSKDVITLKHEYDNYEQTKSYKQVLEINKDGSYSSDRLIGIENENDLKDENFLLKVHNYDPKIWEIVSARNSIWNTQLKGGKVTKLYASKINAKLRNQYKWNEEDINKIFEGLRHISNNTKYIKPKQYEKNGKILIVPIADFHFGLLSDMYSNNNDYNMEIAEELFLTVINEVIENNRGKNFEKVLFVIGNDTTNSDNLNSTTAKGTPQNDCALWFTIVDRITKLLVKGINILREIAPIDIIYVPSNHDLHTMYGVTKTIDAWFKDDENITVDTSPLPRKYYQYGKNILAFSHDVKIKEALKIVSTEASEMWSNSNRAIFMLAHLHQAMEYEKQGKLEILRLPTISGFSRWTNTMGYVQNERKNQTFVLDYNKGIIEIQNTILDL